MKRQRGRSRNNNHNNKPQNANRAMESNGPGVKVRGAVSTIYEKYQQLARDASLSGDRVMAENYMQFAEHYFRVMRTQQEQREAREEEQAAQRAARQAQYDARKAQQQQQQQERAASSAENAPQPTQTPPPATARDTGDAAATQTPAQDSTASHGNGTGPMDVVTPEAVPTPVAAKPARAPRRRVRRPAPEAKAEPKADAKIAGAPDMGGETTA